MTRVKKHWDSTFLQIAQLMAEHSTCARVAVGAVLVRDGRIISSGYNGTPSKQVECISYFYKLWEDLVRPEKHISFEEYLKSDEFKNEHREFSIKNEVHAEPNAIAYAARNGVSTENSTIYLTISPCIQCAKLLISSGIKRVVFNERYDRPEDDGVTLLESARILTEEIHIV